MMPLLVAAGVFLSGRAEAQIGLGLSPMRVEVETRPGGAVSGPLTLANESPARVRFRAELLDFYIDDTGTPQFGRALAREAEHSCRNWLSLNPVEGEIEARSKVTVRFTVTVPPDAAARGFHCAAGFSNLPTAEEAANMGLRSAVRLVTAFYVGTGGPSAAEGEIAGLRVERTGGAARPGWQAVLTLRNWSRRHFRPEGDLELLDPAGNVVEAVKVPAMPVLPSREQRLPVPLATDLTPGGYRLRARVSLGLPEIQEAVVKVLPAPPGQSSQ
jgi:hypothetical protein